MIEPFIFGEKRLFGVFYPSSNMSSDKLIVICPPLFDEYRRAYRALSEFADACAKSGHHALRFDYSGTGDSGGVIEDVSSIDEWLEDLYCSIEEGIALSGASRVVLVGVRWGGTLACLCQHEAVERIVVWDWIKDGSQYAEWLNEVDQSLADEHRPLARSKKGNDANEDYRMFALSTSLLDSMKAVRIDLVSKPVTVLLSKSERGGDVDVEGSEMLNYEYDWPMYENGLIRPMLVLRKMLDYL